MNIGERSEYECILNLFGKKDEIDFCVSVFGEEGSEGIEVLNPDGQPYLHIFEIPKKAKSSSKSDVSILIRKTQRVWHASIKSQSGSAPSILNHTPRSANVFRIGELNSELRNLDQLASEYIEERTKKSISEDVKISNLKAYENEEIRASISNVVTYFFFVGSGRTKSLIECNSILILERGGGIHFIPCESNEKKKIYVNSILGKCVLSFRNKGLKKNIGEFDLPWTAKYHDKVCGAMHIRLSK
jgi:hypothetical protein